MRISKEKLPTGCKKIYGPVFLFSTTHNVKVIHQVNHKVLDFVVVN